MIHHVDKHKDSINQIKKLENYPEFLGAYIFGSVAKGEHNNNSDIDVAILVADSAGCDQINHPFLSGIKCDLSFRTIDQIYKSESDIAQKGERPPYISNSIIVFDKTDELKQLKQKYSKLLPRVIKPEEYQYMLFMIIHADNKAKRHLYTDHFSAHLALNINLNEILKYHYQLNRRWWLSNKFLLGDLRKWDPKLANILESFLTTLDIHQKYNLWLKIIEHVSIPMGGLQPISNLNCKCISCQKYLKFLVE